MNKEDEFENWKWRRDENIKWNNMFHRLIYLCIPLFGRDVR